MITLLGILGLVIALMVALPATLIAIATLIEHPIKTILHLWMDLIQTYKDLWNNLSK
jgi:ABC-type phosphate/phosphonate transport system permease subunit